jgi:hypothetical protein
MSLLDNIDGYFGLTIDRIRRRLKSVADRFVLFLYRLRFHFFFKNKPADGEYCNSRRIFLGKRLADREPRQYLVVIRCGRKHCLVDDGGERNFDIALNMYACPDKKELLDNCEYLYSGGINKFKAAYQFVDDALLDTYQGFAFLDDDLEVTYSHLSQFFHYCSAHGFGLAQPSLSSDSYFSHRQLVNASPSAWRAVEMVEVMCPYFSRGALQVALNTFDLSYSTWGLDHIWPRLLNIEPVVVDEFSIKHTQPGGGSDNAFYRYMRGIGVSPARERHQLRHMSDEEVRSLASKR